MFTLFKVAPKSPTSDPNLKIMSKIYEEVYCLIILCKITGLYLEQQLQVGKYLFIAVVNNVLI